MFLFLKWGTCLGVAGRTWGRSPRRQRDSVVFTRTEFAAAATRIPPDLPRHSRASFQHAFLLTYSQVCLMSALHGIDRDTPSCRAGANRNQLGVKAKFSNFLSSPSSDCWKLISLVLVCYNVQDCQRAMVEPSQPSTNLLLFKDKKSLKIYMYICRLGEIYNISEMEYHV